MGKIAIVTKQFEKSNITANLIRISPNRKIIFPKFFMYVLLDKSFQSQLYTFSSQTTIMTIQSNELKSIKFFIPPIKEQQKIASILSRVDALIETTQECIKKTQKLKKGLMHRLLIKGIAHKKLKKIKWLFGKNIEIPEDWNLKKITDIGEINGGGTPDTTNIDYWGGNVLWAVPTDITKLKNNKIDNTKKKITKEGLTNSSAKLLPSNTILITTRATIGKCAITTKRIIEYKSRISKYNM